MKISGPNQVSSTSKAKGAGKAGGDGGFSKLLEGTSEEKEIGGLTGVSKIAGVFFQEVDENGKGKQRRKQLVDDANDILDELIKIRDSLLFGKISVSNLQSIQAKIEKIEADCDDPKLNELIEEVKIRAAVELAKLGF